MANVRRPTSGYYETDGGKYYWLIEVTMTNAAVTITPHFKVVSAFDSAHVARVYYGDGSKQEKKVRKTDQTFAKKSAKAQTYNMNLVLTFNGRKVTIPKNTIEYLNSKPKAPGGVSAWRVNDATLNISVGGHSYTAFPTDRIYIQRAVDTKNSNDWQDIGYRAIEVAGGKDYSIDIKDTNVERGHAYYYRVRAYNIRANKYSEFIYPPALNSKGVPSYPVYTTATNESLVGSVAVQRRSNTQAELSWEISNVNIVAQGLVTNFLVYRSTNGASYRHIGTVSANTSHTAYSYVDKTCSRNSTYQYKIKCDGRGPAAETFSDATELIYMSPSAPSSIDAARDSNGNINVKVKGLSYTATDVEIWKSLNGGAYTLLTTEGYESEVSYLDEDVEASDSVLYKTRYKCSELTGDDQFSGYITSSAVSLVLVPNPPSLKAPVDLAAIDLAQGSVRLAFQHNPQDGSAQEAARLRYRVNEDSWETVELADEAIYTLDLGLYSALDVISWQVQTKGAHPDYSDWSEEFSFLIKTAPELAFTLPDNDDVISELPVMLEWEYHDASGRLQSLTVDIIKDHTKVHTFDVDVGAGESGIYSYSLAGFLFENNTVYSITATALSDSGLSAISDIAITIAYEDISLEGGLIPVADFDEDGVATILIDRDITIPEDGAEEPEPVQMQTVYLYRRHDGERVLVAEGLDEGSTVEDKYAPLNVPFQYELLMFTEDSRVSIVTTEVIQTSDYSYVYWGDGQIARAQFNMEGNASLSRPEKNQVRYSGRRYPVTYDSGALEETLSFSATILDKEELDSFRHMIRNGGYGIWKSSDGDVYDADFEFDYSTKYYESTRYWDCSLDVTRIEGD